MIPKSRLDEALERVRIAEEKLGKYQTDSEKAEAERLKKQGEWQQIAEKANTQVAELEPYKSRAEIAEAAMTKASEALILRIPEDMRDIVPDVSPTAKFIWLTANVERLARRPAPNTDAGAGGAGGAGGDSTALTQEEAAHAQAVGMTPAEWVAARNKSKQR